MTYNFDNFEFFIEILSDFGVFKSSEFPIVLAESRLMEASPCSVKVQLMGAPLAEAQLDGAPLAESQLDGATFGGGFPLFGEGPVNGCSSESLTEAQLDGAPFGGVPVGWCSFCGVSIVGCFFCGGPIF